MTAGRRHRLLVVDDAVDTREVLQRNLTAQGYEVMTAGDVAEALRILETLSVDLVITDLKMPGTSGLELVRHVREHLKTSEVITITGYPSVEGAIAAVKSGAEEYLTKPFTQHELFEAVARAIQKLDGGAADVSAHERAPHETFGLVATSDAMQILMASIPKIAATRAPVLVTGEAGTGRTTVARLIHRLSPIGAAPLAAVDCDGGPGDWIEAQLFGVAGRPVNDPARGGGLLRLVDEGTVLLREVAALTPTTQRRLAEVLEVMTPVRPAEHLRASPVRCRLMAVSADDLRARVADGRFRGDLFERLAAQTLAMPPLRERGHDITLLAQRFLAGFASHHGRPVPTLTDRALGVLQGYGWPSNLPELAQCMRSIVESGSPGPIDVSDLPDTLRAFARSAAGANRTLADVEADHIRSVLASVGHNKTRAAEILGINRKTLREKLRDPDPDTPSA